ncbi:SURF1 family protein [Pikeienuella piscinae]|uniref:SURF1-like protein n=1 Tax=Pikeienuella piscinae TaxID=2748098 RepID=A0A7L5BWH0_9RHOB|nr:SURF1 family protein [Pikeienuella piscinae]QIE56235.1 SURF1 family protein [Pikeienuella piscinae]
MLTGALGAAVLVSLCIWQIQRLEWKEGVITTLETRLSGAPTALPEAFDPATQEFTRVVIKGRFDGAPGAHGFDDAPLLTSLPPYGPGYRVIQPFVLDDGRRVLVDRGYLPVTEKNVAGAASRPTPAPDGVIEITGALRWPDEGREGPDFGAVDNVWVNRDLDEMAALFGTEPVLIVAETSTAVGDWPIPRPIEAINVPNNHLNYAITWGALALIWAGMTAWLVVRPQKSSS